MDEAKSILKSAVACAAMLCCAGAAAQEAQVSLADKGKGSYVVQGSFTVNASSQQIWGVLSDYNGIAKFVTSLLSSRVKEREGDRLLLEQVAVGRLLMFSRTIHVLLDVREQPLRSIRFSDVSHEDFDVYDGIWSIEPSPDGFKVSYELDAKRKFAAPGFLAKGLFLRNAADLLNQVRTEILRRASVEGQDRPHEYLPPCTPSSSC